MDRKGPGAFEHPRHETIRNFNGCGVGGGDQSQPPLRRDKHRLRVSIVSIAVSIALAIVGHSADVGRHGRFEGKHFNPGQLIPAKLSG
jgi:hypothetical protein